MGRFSNKLSKRLRGKPEDKNLVRQAVERDARRFADTIADAAARHPATESDSSAPSSDGPPDFISFEVGARDDLSRAAAERTGKQWRELVVHYPKAHFVPHILGYDDDPRALWDFPEVCEYMRAWAKAAGIRRIDDMPSVDTSTIVFFAACGVFGPVAEAKARPESKPTEQ